MEQRLTELLDTGDALKTTADIVEKTNAAVVAVEKSTEKVTEKTEDKIMKLESSHNIRQCFREQGVPVDPTKKKGVKTKLWASSRKFLYETPWKNLRLSKETKNTIVNSSKWTKNPSRGSKKP